jgi:hypothetical protein
MWGFISGLFWLLVCLALIFALVAFKSYNKLQSHAQTIRERSSNIQVAEHPSVAYLARHGLKRHYSFRSGWDYPGFYLGDASNLDDLVTFWNLPACDTALWFVDAQHVARYQAIIPSWKKSVQDTLSFRKDKFPEHVAIWGRRETLGDAGNAAALRTPFGEGPHTICGVDEYSWNGLNVRPPMMHFSEVAALGVLVTESGKPKLSFGLSDKPFCGRHMVSHTASGRLALVYRRPIRERRLHA